MSGGSDTDECCEMSAAVFELDLFIKGTAFGYLAENNIA